MEKSIFPVFTALSKAFEKNLKKNSFWGVDRYHDVMVQFRQQRTAHRQQAEQEGTKVMAKIRVYETKEAMLDSMERIARQTVKHYFTDFTEYDIPAVLNSDKPVYYWIVRECGTHYIPSTSIDHVRAVLETWTDCKVYQIVFGHNVQTIEKIKAADLYRKIA